MGGKNMTSVAEPSVCVWRPPLDLNGQVAVITGGSSGIGLGVAEDLDRRGCRVVIAARDGGRVQHAVDSLRHAVGFPDCDVSVPERVDALFGFAAERFGGVDILVASAGIGRSRLTPTGSPRPVAMLKEEEWDEVIDTNLRGAFLASRAAARMMVHRRRGQIVNISSARGALKGQACGAGYCASKMAARAMFQSLADELAPLGIRVLALLPDAVDTALIAGTTLAPRGALRCEDVGRFVGNMLAMPIDASLREPLLAPHGTRTERRR
jgi:NAD(P)-dependent dehydrogenase (short-subunit alcohol dehydrogenase family)